MFRIEKLNVWPQAFLQQQTKIELHERAVELARMLSGVRSSLLRRELSAGS